MSQRTVTLGPDGQLRVSAEYNEKIRLLLKTLPGARWDGRDRVWCIPVQHRTVLLKRLEGLEFAVDPALAEAGRGGFAPLDDTLTVLQINQQIRTSLRRGFPESIWVKGELSGFEKTAARATWFFELVEKQAGNEVARLCATVYSDTRAHIEWRLRQAAEPLELRDGLEVRIRGRIDYFARNGRLQLLVDEIDPDYVLGRMARRREEILEALVRAGLLERNRRLPWPTLPLRVGLVTAPGSDAYHDFVRTLQACPFGFEVVHVPASVQGPRMEPEMLAALDWFARRPGRVDVVAIVRGGGSRADLAWLDNLRIARAIATHGCKVLVGLGHERDRSVLDEVAESFKTPTAVAEHVIDRVSRTEEALERLARRLGDRSRQRLTLARRQHHGCQAKLVSLARTRMQRARIHVERDLARALRRAVRARLATEHGRLRALQTRLRPTALRRRLTDVSARLLACERRLRLRARAPLRRDQQALEAFSQRLRAAVASGLRGERARLAVLDARTRAVDPARTLARGYAIVHDANGRLVRAPSDAPVGSPIRVALAGGQLEAVVERHGRSTEPE